MGVNSSTHFGEEPKIVIGLQIYQHLSTAGIHYAQSPERALVKGLVKHRLDISRNIGSIGNRSGAAPAATAERSRQKSKEES